MRVRGGVAILSVALVGVSGCASTRRYWDKPLGRGAWIPAVACGAIGAGVGMLIQNERRGTSRVVIQDANGTRTTSVTDDAELWKGAVVGAPIGAVVCGLLGHALFDPEVVATPPPPPPPPPPSPTPEPLPPTSSKRIVLRGVHFDFNKSDIRADSRPVLDESAELLRENLNVRITVEGHTDAIGGEDYNQQLSVRRAEAVFRYLVNHGVAPDRMDVVGYGKSRPVADNETESGQAQNRRVELHVVNQTQGSHE
jgi:outer membrane protein OmpA-like peptidoglycan-associated protein